MQDSTFIGSKSHLYALPLNGPFPRSCPLKQVIGYDSTTGGSHGVQENLILRLSKVTLPDVSAAARHGYFHAPNPQATNRWP